MTYQRLCFLSSEEKRALAPDYIILDEFHRCGADEWGTVVQKMISQKGSVNFLYLHYTFETDPPLWGGGFSKTC